MKFLLILVVTVSGLFLTNSDLNAQYIKEWYSSVSGSHKFGLKKSVFKTEGNSAFLKLTNKNVDGSVNLIQTCHADEYLGKRVKMTAYIKTRKASGDTGMWMTIFSKKQDNERLGFDDVLSFDNVILTGNKNWTYCAIVLDVPEESGTISFGVRIDGRKSKIWFDVISFEIVDDTETEITRTAENNGEKFPIGSIVNPILVLNERVTNLDFK